MKDSDPCLRGSVWWVRLDPAEGSEQGGTRPVAVIGSDILNRALPVVLIAPMTSRNTGHVFRTEVVVQPPEGGPSKPSKIPLYQVRTVAKSRILGYLGAALRRNNGQGGRRTACRPIPRVRRSLTTPLVSWLRGLLGRPRHQGARRWDIGPAPGAIMVNSRPSSERQCAHCPPRSSLP